MSSTTPTNKSQSRKAAPNNEESSSSSGGIAEELGISEGYVIQASKSTYVVIKLLGEGGFGAVFKVYDKKDSRKFYAVKVEKRLQKHSKLRMEIAILKEANKKIEEQHQKEQKDPKNAGKVVAKRRNHFTQIIDRGRKDMFFFLVMELLGKSLSDLKDVRPKRVFSMGTGLGAAKQCLEAVQDLHAVDFIHRDLKPANYAIGLGPRQNIVYILDFGIARRMTNARGERKTPRAFVNFKGTIRFASVACHRNQELAFKDDVESWLYLLMDLIVPNGLPWKNLETKDEVLKLKDECHKTKRELLFPTIAAGDILTKILDYLNSLLYQDHVDYAFIYDCLEEAAKKSNVSTSPPYDWMKS